ncbi:MAG: hypothetical protein D6753_01715 [Planctomycetota bacterium]|nr:MAG: hypothetical protein D6753_01715 [Planctomycetota bacterium]
MTCGFRRMSGTNAHPGRQAATPTKQTAHQPTTRRRRHTLRRNGNGGTPNDLFRRGDRAIAKETQRAIPRSANTASVECPPWHIPVYRHNPSRPFSPTLPKPPINGARIAVAPPPRSFQPEYSPRSTLGSSDAAGSSNRSTGPEVTRLLGSPFLSSMFPSGRFRTTAIRRHRFIRGPHSMCNMHRSAFPPPTHPHWLLTATWLVASIFAIPAPGVVAAEPVTASNTLRDYVATPDDSYAWELRERFEMNGCEVLRLHLQSQTWQGVPWRHILYLIRPPGLPADSQDAVLVVAGGSWKPEWPPNGPDSVSVRGEAQLMSAVARQFNCVIAVLTLVPFQPMFDGKYEDEIIAATFAKFVETSDPSWPLLLPMVKAAVRGMDAATEAAARHWKVQLKEFTVTGASKRGWTTWLTGAIDPRATVIAPMVIDMLNMEVQMKHQLASWGDYSEQIADYTELELPKYLGTERGRRLQAIVDPYAYRQQLQQPKLLIFGTNDRYWPIDACKNYWQDLVGPKYLLYVPNQGHGIDDYARVIGTVVALHRSVHGGPPVPELSWSFATPSDQKVVLDVTALGAVDSVRGWMATSPTRDFREARWRQVSARPNGDGKWKVEVSRPPDAFLALYAEAVGGAGELPSFWSTSVEVFAPASTGADTE